VQKPETFARLRFVGELKKYSPLTPE